MEQRNHDAVLVTLADRNFIDQAKQLFSSVYWNAGWKGDYMLLAHEIPEKDLKWFRNKGILVKKCKPLWGEDLGTEKRKYPKTVLDKFYLFTTEFKKWKNVVFLDADIIVRASLDKLAKVNGFWAVRDLEEPKLEDQVLEQNRDILAKKGFHLRDYAFNSGVMAFSTYIIKDDYFKCLIKVLNEYIKISLYSDQLIFNVYFYRKWNKLPLTYNILNHLFRHKKIKGVILHFVNQLYSHNKCWDKKNDYYKEWKSNLNKAEEINLSNIPKGIKQGNFKIVKNSFWIYFRYLNYITLKSFRSNKSFLKNHIHLPLYNFIKYQIMTRIKRFPEKIMGIFGIFIKKINPNLYYKLKGKNGTKKS